VPSSNPAYVETWVRLEMYWISVAEVDSLPYRDPDNLVVDISCSFHHLVEKLSPHPMERRKQRRVHLRRAVIHYGNGGDCSLKVILRQVDGRINGCALLRPSSPLPDMLSCNQARVSKNANGSV